MPALTNELNNIKEPNVRNLDPLYPYQCENAIELLRLIKTRGSAADRSDMGTGKTWTAAVVARECGLPVYIIAPKSVIPNWRHTTSACGFVPALITNYERLRSGKDGVYTPKDGWNGNGKSLIIFDEAHKLRGRRTQQTAMLSKAREAGHAILLLSATLAGSALDFSAIGYALGLFPNPSGWWQWARRHGGYINRWGGYAASTDTMHLTRIGETLNKVSVRTQIKDLGYELPCVTVADLVSVPPVQLREVIEDVVLEAAIEEDVDKHNAAALIARGRARKMQEEAKVPYLVEETKQLVEQGYSVIVFLNFDDSLEDFYTQFQGISMIRGGQTEERRDWNVQQFQSNVHKVLVANIKAGGVGLSLHDISGNHPRVALLSPPESAIDLLQALGRIRRVGMLSSAVNRILFSADSVEHSVYKQVSRKLQNIQLINDSDLEYEVNNEN